MTTVPFDLKARAHQAMLAAGFQPDFPAEVVREVQARKQAIAPATGARDLRSLPWSSIDNDSSRDLDQVEYAEKLPDGSVRLLVGIADVDASVPKGSATDRHAAAEATSVYTGVASFPMLPGELSTDLTSLLDAQDRLFPRHRIAYSRIGRGYGPRGLSGLALQPGETGLQLDGRLAGRTRDDPVRSRRRAGNGGATASARGDLEKVAGHPQAARGADFRIRRNHAGDAKWRSKGPGGQAGTRWPRTSLRISWWPRMWPWPNISRRKARSPSAGWCGLRGAGTASRPSPPNSASQLPSAPDPRALAEFLDQRKAADPAHFPDLSLSVVKLLGPGEYIVEPPGAEQEGHFGLAVQDYTHSTAPNRRYADLVTQRLLKATAAGGAGAVFGSRT